MHYSNTTPSTKVPISLHQGPGGPCYSTLSTLTHFPPHSNPRRLSFLDHLSISVAFGQKMYNMK